MSAVEIALLIDERRQSDWSADDSDLLVGTTDTTAIAMLREQIGRTRDGELNLVPTDEKDMLAQFQLLSKSGAALSNAGAVAVGWGPESRPRVTYHLSIIRWNGTRISEDNTQDIARNTSRHPCSDCSKNANFSVELSKRHPITDR